MRRSLVAVGAVVVVALVAGGVVVAQAADPFVSERRASVDAVAVTDPAGSVDGGRGDVWTLAQAEGSAVVPGGRVIAESPAAVTTVPVTLDPEVIEQYWLWASGVQVTAHGLTPGSTVWVAITFASGTRKQWAPVTADADGTVVTRVRTLDVDPENTRPEAGLAQMSVTSSAGEAGSALLTVLPTAGDALTVTSDPGTISQDEFLDNPVTVHVSGLPPMSRVFFNLGTPDTAMMQVGVTEGLHSDENGDFTYELQMLTANAQTGEWLLSFQSFDGALQGSGTFTVTPGAERVADKTLVTAAEISVAAFSTSPGLEFTLDGFVPFDTYELTLTTSRGVLVPLGIARTNGEGRAANNVTSPQGIPEGTYELTARSTTTGDYAQSRFEVTGNPELPAAAFALTPSSLSASALSDPAAGTVLDGQDITPGTFFRVSLRDAQWRRMPLTVGADAYVSADGSGQLSLTLVTLETVPAGTYTVWLDGGGGVAGYNLHLPLVVTADPEVATAAPPASAPTAPPGPVTPVPAAPAGPGPQAAPGTPPPAPTATPDPAPTPDGTPVSDPFEDDVTPPVQNVPSLPAL